MRRILVFLVLSVLSALAPVANSADPSQNGEGGAVPPARIDIAGTVQALKQVKIEGDDPRVPESLRPLLTKLKHQLRDLITRTLAAHVTDAAQLEGARKALMGELRKEGIGLEDPNLVVVDHEYEVMDFTYGDIGAIHLSKVTSLPDLLAVTTTLPIVCGTDTSFYLYQKGDRGWELILAQEAGEYEEVNGAQGSFRWGVSTPTDAGEWFVLTKRVNPWCTSNWHGIYYKILLPGASPYQPRILADEHHSVWIGDEIDGLCLMRAGGFTMDFDAEQYLDSGILIRRHVVSYEVEGGKARRVPPFAREPEGFLDEWFDLPWEEAVKWVDRSLVAAAQLWHSKVHGDRFGEKSNLDTEFTFDPPACRMKPDAWQVGLEVSPRHEGAPLPKGITREVFFTIKSRKDAYFISGISSTCSAKCKPQVASEP